MRTSQGPAILLKNYKEPEYRTTETDLDINLHPTETRVKSRLTVQRGKGIAKDTPLVLDGDELQLVSVAVEGKPLATKDYTEKPFSLTIKSVPKKQKFVVEIETEINPTANTQLSGLYRSGGNYCTQCEAEGFRRITYFQDRPDVLAVYTTRIEGPKEDVPVLLGNGNPVKRGSAGKGRHYAIWHDPHPKPSYLFALVGGDLGSIYQNFKTRSGRNVKLGIYVEKGKETSAGYAMDALVRSMKWDEREFGCEYDLDVFNIVAISDFNMGAMENKGLNIFNDKYVLADPNTATDADYANIERIIAHEYFHNWTGNRITCRDWFQLCLKEGLTVYRDQEFSSDERSRAVIRIGDVRGLKANQFPEDAGPLAHPVRPDAYREINNFYTATVYQKGAELVRMIATILGEKKFKKGMDLYFKRHDGDAATIEDFIACFERAAKTDLSHFALWYSQAGTPHLNVSSKYEKPKNRLTLEVEQVTPATPGQRRKLPVHIPQRIELLGSTGKEIKPKKVSGIEESGGVYHVTNRKHRIVMDGVSERPVPSLNRGFTAPVEVNFRQSAADLAFLAANDTDPFNQWQSYQNIAIRLLISGTKAIQAGKPFAVDRAFLDLSLKIAQMENLEPAFRAVILTLPSEGDLAQAIGRNVNPDAIHAARKTVLVALGKTLEPARPGLMKTLKTSGTFDPGAEAAGKRSFKNLLLSIAAIGGSKTAWNEIARQAGSANNMTDRFSALQTIVYHHSSAMIRNRALAAFYKRYNKNHIVLDKWFAVQAMKPGSSTITTVKKLIKHEDFSFTNPNRMRSLIGMFAAANPTAFNAENGKGFLLIADAVRKLDKINPQMAARLLTSFRSFRSLDAPRRKMAESTLKDLAGSGDFSRDVSDILGRTLG